MQVFKTALRIFSKHPLYILIYVFWLTVMGVFIGTSAVSAPQAEFTEDRPEIAIIDRDKSDLSAGLSEFLGEYSTVIEIEDTRLAMQDAIAQDRVQYIMIVPQGFEDAFTDNLNSDASIPSLETVTSYESIAAHMMDGLVDEYLGTVKIYLQTETSSSVADAVDLARNDMTQSAQAAIVQFGESSAVSQQWVLYMTFSGYTIMLSIIICVGVMMGSFNRTDIRRRDLSSPVSTFSMNLQIGLASLVVTLLIWAWVCILGLVVFGGSLFGVSPTIIGLSMLSLLAYCSVPLAIGFFLGLLSVSELVMNAAANIIGLICSFLGGIWMSLDLLSDGVLILAHFVPTFYYGDAIVQAVNLRDFSAGSLSPLFIDMGIMLLFAAAIVMIALVVSRLRVQSSEAGGNAAAARGRS